MAEDEERVCEKAVLRTGEEKETVVGLECAASAETAVRTSVNSADLWISSRVHVHHFRVSPPSLSS